MALKANTPLIKPDGKLYLPFEAYKKAAGVLEVFATIILFSLVNHSTGVRDNIIRNFIARSVTTLKGITRLWEIEDYADCWVLNRCILDRLFHLRALAKDDAFDLFEKWSFKRQYDSKNRIHSDPEFKGTLNPDFFRDLRTKKKRYDKVSKERIQWERPEAKDIAKEMGLGFLYKYGYDYASSRVHPMANDGEEDFLRLTKLKLSGGNVLVDQRSVISNSCLAVAILIQEGLEDSNLAWENIIFNFLRDFVSFLKDGSKIYMATFSTIASLGPDVDFCRKRDKQDKTI
jgi:hypothetical protein